MRVKDLLYYFESYNLPMTLTDSVQDRLQKTLMLYLEEIESSYGRLITRDSQSVVRRLK